MKALYEATEGNRLLAFTGTELAQDRAVPAEDLAAACTYLGGEGLITSTGPRARRRPWSR